MTVQPGSIHYVEIVTPDVEAVRALYETCHGVRFQPKDPVLGNAHVAALPAGPLCGIRAPMHSAEKPVVRTYLRVNNLANSVQLAAVRGANILLERMELPGRGIIAIYEQGGVEHGLWQVEQSPGATAVAHAGGGNDRRRTRGGGGTNAGR